MKFEVQLKDEQIKNEQLHQFNQELKKAKKEIDAEVRYIGVCRFLGMYKYFLFYFTTSTVLTSIRYHYLAIYSSLLTIPLTHKHPFPSLKNLSLSLRQ